VRFLGIGDGNDLGDLYLRLAAAGHEVRVHIALPAAHDILAGLIERVDDWRSELPWIAAAGNDGVILFETATHGLLQDQLRRDGHQVIGGSGFGDRLEQDRTFGQEVMRSCGMQTAPVHSFTDHGEAADFVRRHPGRYVYKPDGAGGVSSRTYIGSRADGSDILALLSVRPAAGAFVLMEHIVGVEVGVGAYFNGERFLTPACLDWEHKRFFPGDLGELTGEMGTLVTYRGAERLFAATLAGVADRLRAAHHVGYINLNTIVDRQGQVWPLEFTSRFGYPGYAILDPLQEAGWDDLLRRLLRRDSDRFPTRAGWALGVVLTVPPFPHPYGYAELSKGLAIGFADDLTAEERDGIHLAEVAQYDGRLVCAGELGYLMVASGRGDSPQAARTRAYATAAKVVVPGLRYRLDIGEQFIARDRAELERLGYLPTS